MTWQNGPALAAARARAVPTLQPDDAPRTPVGTLPALSGSHPCLPPPGENFAPTKVGGGFVARPENRWRPGMPTHDRQRITPKPPGWRPHSPGSKLSDLDVAAIRASREPQAILAELYGVSPWTVKAVRSGRRGNGSWCKPRPIEPQLSAADILQTVNRELLVLSRKCRRLMRTAAKRERGEEAIRAVEQAGEMTETLAAASTARRRP